AWRGRWSPGGRLGRGWGIAGRGAAGWGQRSGVAGRGAAPGVARRRPSMSEPACLIRLSTGEISSCRTPAAALILVVTYSYSASESRHTTLATRLADPVMAAANG